MPGNQVRGYPRKMQNELILMYTRNSAFRIGFSGDHIIEYTPFWVGEFTFSCSYSLNGSGQWASASASNAYEVGLGEYKMGDVVGCGIDWARERYFFTLNGHKGGKNQSTIRIAPWSNSWFQMTWLAIS